MWVGCFLFVGFVGVECYVCFFVLVCVGFFGVFWVRVCLLLFREIYVAVVGGCSGGWLLVSLGVCFRVLLGVFSRSRFLCLCGWCLCLCWGVVFCCWWCVFV